MAANAWQLGEGGTCRKPKISTNVRATFAKLLVSGCTVNLVNNLKNRNNEI